MNWSFALAAGSIFGLWLVSKNQRAGWIFCIIMEIPWTLWSLWIEAYGFALLCVAYGFVYAWNLRGVERKENERLKDL